MNKAFKQVLGLVGAIAIGSTALAQDSGALVDALVKKGILNSQEAEDIRADLMKENAQTPAGKLNLAGHVTQLKLYGDARVRYQWENKEDQTGGAASTNNADRSRFRYRLRLGAEYQLTDNFKTGVQLETALASDSTNANFGNYWDKQGDQLNIGLVYLQYENKNMGFADMVDVRLGKHKHPFVISQAFWDGDLNPEGLSEQIGWNNVGVDGLNLTLRGGQYVVTEENNATANTDDAFLFVAQGDLTYKISSDSSVTLAPMVLAESNGTTLAGENGVNTFDNENSTTSLGNLMVLALPAEYKWKMFEQKNKLYATYGYNFDGNRRLKDIGVSHATNPNLQKEGHNSFWNVGYEIGDNKKKGDWKLGIEYRWIEAAAYSTNLSDSDFAKNEFNQHGIVLTSAYNFTDYLTGAVTWMHSNDIDQGIDVGTSDAATANLLQVDVAWKF